MKTKQLLMLTAACMCATVICAEEQEVKSNYYDAYVDQAGTVNAYSDMLLINNGSADAPNMTCAVINFLLPAIPSGLELVDASFQATVTLKNAWVDSDADLYGITARAADVAIAGDYYSGAFTLGNGAGNGSDWGIMESFFVKDEIPDDSTPTTCYTDTSANAQLVAFLQSQYDNDAVNTYAFLRINYNLDVTTAWQRYSIASEANADYYPRITLTFDTPSGLVEGVSDSSSAVYGYNGKLQVELNKAYQQAVVNVYSIGGALVSTASVAGTSTSIDVAQGIYVVELILDGASTTRKIKL